MWIFGSESIGGSNALSFACKKPIISLYVLWLKNNRHKCTSFIGLLFNPSIGPLVGHGSNRVSCKRKLMLDSMNKGSYGLDVEDFFIESKMRGKYPLIMMHDPYHV